MTCAWLLQHLEDEARSRLSEAAPSDDPYEHEAHVEAVMLLLRSRGVFAGRAEAMVACPSP